MEYSLTLSFVCTNGEKSSLTIDGVKSDLTEAKIQEVMDTLIEKNIFYTKNGDYVEKDEATLTQKTTSNYTFQ